MYAEAGAHLWKKCPLFHKQQTMDLRSSPCTFRLLHWLLLTVVLRNKKWPWRHRYVCIAVENDRSITQCWRNCNKLQYLQYAKDDTTEMQCSHYISLSHTLVIRLTPSYCSPSSEQQQTVQRFLQGFSNGVLCILHCGRMVCCHSTQWNISFSIFMASVSHDLRHGRMHGNGRRYQKIGWVHQYQNPWDVGFVWYDFESCRGVCHLLQQEFVRTTAFYQFSWKVRFDIGRGIRRCGHGRWHLFASWFWCRQDEFNHSTGAQNHVESGLGIGLAHCGFGNVSNDARSIVAGLVWIAIASVGTLYSCVINNISM